MLNNIIKNNYMNIAFIIIFTIFIYNNINVSTNASMHIIIMFLIIFSYLYYTKEISDNNFKNSDYNKLSKNVNSKYKYIYSNYLINIFL